MNLFLNKKLLTFFVLIVHTSIVQSAQQIELVRVSSISSIESNSSQATDKENSWQAPFIMLHERATTPPIERNIKNIPHANNYVRPKNNCCFYLQGTLVSCLFLGTCSMSIRELHNHHRFNQATQLRHVPTQMPTKFNPIQQSLRGHLHQKKEKTE